MSVSFDVQDGKAQYAIQYDGKTVIDASSLGIRLKDGGPIRDDLVAREASVEDVDLTWEPVWGIQSSIADRYQELRVALKESGGKGRALNLYFRAYDDGAAFRYEIPVQDGIGNVEITGEHRDPLPRRPQGLRPVAKRLRG